MPWQSAQLHDIRQETHFGRRLRCFANRPQSLDAMLRASAARFPGKPALILGDMRLTYAEFDERVERVATALHRRFGVGKSDRVALLLNNSLEFAVAFFACARLGAISVPLNTRLAPPEIQFMLSNSGARVLIADPQVYGRVAMAIDQVSSLVHRFTTGAGYPGTRPWVELEESAKAPAVTVSEEDVASILYTSGTTGLPKGAALTHFNFAHTALHYQRAMGITEEDRTLIAVPMFHVTGLAAQLVLMVHVGGTSIILPEFKADRFLTVAEAEGMTHTIVVPSIYVLCLMNPRINEVRLEHWRIAAYGGAPMPEATIMAMAERFPSVRLMNAYGATETCSPTTLMPPEDTAARPGSVGLPVMCAELKVVDDEGRELPHDQPGELLIRGPMVVPGYWANPEATERSFVEGYWRSGDVARIDRDGYVYILDRKKDMINRGGYKIYSAEVENVLYQYEEILEAAVVGVPDPVLGERVKAVVVPKPGHQVDIQRLRYFCADHLADYKVPELVEVVPQLPRNPGGKVMKHLLRGTWSG